MAAVVYFAQSDQTGLVKVGATYCVENRMQLLRSVRGGRSVKLLATIPGMRGLESQFLRHFWSRHVGREWFQPDADMLADIARVAAGTFDIAELPQGPNPILSEAMCASHARRRDRLAAAA